MQIWHLSLVDLTFLMLWRTGEREFRVVRAGEPAVLLTNADYILFDRKFSSVLGMLKEQVIYSPVTVSDNVKRITFDNYIEVKIKNEITPDSIRSMDDQGLKIWAFSNKHVFVSDELKREFEKVAKGAFKFSEGFSHFGGGLS